MLSTIASEDKRFFNHGVVDATAITRAVAQNVGHARVISGARRKASTGKGASAAPISPPGTIMGDRGAKRESA